MNRCIHASSDIIDRSSMRGGLLPVATGGSDDRNLYREASFLLNPN